MLGIIITALILTPAQYQVTAVRNSVIPAGLLIVFSVFLSLFKNKKLLLLLIFILFFLDLGRYFRKHTPFVDSQFIFPITPTLEFLQNQPRPFRIASQDAPLLKPNTWLPYKLESISGYDPLRLLSYNRLFNLLENNKYFDTVSRFSEIHNDIRPEFLDALNVKYFLKLTSKQDTVSQKLLKYGYTKIFEDKSVQILENPHVLDRAYFVDRVDFVKTETDLARILDNPGFDPRSRTVLLTDFSFPITNKPVNTNVKILNHQDNQVILRVKTDTLSLLVLADSYAPGWSAYLDDHQTPIYKANAALRAVLVPPGEHQIIFNYNPRSFQLGLSLSVLSLIILLVWFFKKSKLL